jgi:hypothetical protein
VAPADATVANEEPERLPRIRIHPDVLELSDRGPIDVIDA